MLQPHLLRFFLGTTLIGAGFFALAASDPGIVFSAVVGGRQVAFFTPENRFATNESPPVVTVISTAHAGSVRARFTACPVGLEGCVADHPFTLHLPSGSATLTFPEIARPVTLDVQRVPWHPFYLAFLLCLGTGLGLLFPSCRWLIAAVVCTSGLYFSQTMGELRSLDVGGHLTHVAKIASDGVFVNAQACWECFHPPLYYVLGSLLLGFPMVLPPWGATLLQGLALLLHGLSVPLVVAALRGYRGGLWAAALVVLWPAAVLQSVRLGNDGLLNLFAFGVILLLLRERLALAAGVAAAALLVKDSALVLVAVVGIWGCYGAFRAKERFWAGGALAAGFSVRAVSARLKHYDPARMDALSENLRVANTWHNVLLPDLISFVRDPFVNPWVPSGNREHVLNYFGKSSLFGEWAYDFPLAGIWARLLSDLLLLIAGVATAAWWRGGRRVFPALLVGCGVGAVMAYRVLHPFASNPDFRFVYPLVAMGIALALDLGRRWERGLVIAFLAVSECVFVLHWWFES